MAKLLKRALRIFFYLAAVVVAAALGALIVFTTTERGRDNLAGLISSIASTPGSKVTVAGIDGIWSGALRVDHVVLEDSKGPWLVLRQVAVDWSPFALLTRTFSADRVAVGRIEAARLPVSEGEPKRDTEGGFSLPVSLDIKAIDLPNIALGEALAGAGIAELAAKGSVKADASPLAVAAKLNVARNDGKQGTVDATVDFAPADNKLDLDVKASEPAGGILANLLQLPGDPSVDITLAGKGSLADWNGTGSFSVDGQVVTQLTGRNQQTEKGNRIEAKGDGDFARFLPDRFKPLLAGRTDFAFTGTATKTGGVEIEQAQINSDAVRGTAAGHVDPKGATDFSLQFNSVGPTLPLALGSKESPIDIEMKSATLRAFGEGSAPALDIGASLAKVTTTVTKFENIDLTIHSDNFDVANRVGPMTGSLTVDRIGFDNPTIAPLIAGKIKADVAGSLAKETINVDKGSIRSDTLIGDFNGKMALADGSIELNVKADAASSALPAAARPALGERAVLSAAIRRDSKGTVTADSITLDSGAVSASGSASLHEGQIVAELKGALADLSLLSKEAKGAIGLSVTAKGVMVAPDVSVSLSGDKLEVAGREISGLSLSAAGRADVANPAADVTLSATIAGQPLQGKAVLKTENGQRRIDGLKLALGNNGVAGDLVLDEAFLPEGTVTIDLPDIGPLAALALEKAEGDVRGTVRFAKRDGVPELALQAKAGIKRGDLIARNVAIDALVSNYAAAPAVSGTVRADAVTSGTTTITGIAVDLKRDGDWTGFSGGATIKDIPARAVGRVKSTGGVTTLELASGQAVIRGLKAVIPELSTVTVANGTTTIQKLVVGVDSGRATITGTAGKALDIDVALTNLPVAAANTFSPGLGAAGTVSGTAKVTGAASAPSVTYNIKASGLGVAATRDAGIGAINLASGGTFVSNKLTFNADIGGAAGLALKGGGSVTTAGTPNLSVDIAGNVPFELLARKLAEQGLSLTGGANVAVQVRGPASKPVISGSVRSSGARVLDANSGLAVKDITLDIGMANGIATINRLTGTLSTRGTLSAGGTVGIDAGSGFPADLSIKLVDGRYTDGRIVTANLGGDLTIKGPLATAPAVSGTINLGKVVVTVPERLPTSLSTLNIKRKDAPAAVKAQDKALRPSGASSSAGNGGGGLTLDVTVNAPNQIFVMGRGLDAELGGNLRLTGPASAPQAVGKFTLQRGRLSILGKRLTFTEGTLTFSGSLVPYLNMVAESTAGDATVNITVSGEATNPKFTFSSVPALPEDEVLARLIFGRSMSNLSPLQIAQLAEAAAQLSGVGGSTSLLEKLRGKLGVDDLDVTTDDQGGTAVSAGKYLNDRTYLNIQKGEKPGSGRARIDFNVGKGVKLRGEASDDGEAKGGIFYEKEY